MTLEEIKAALSHGLAVRWVHDDFHVVQPANRRVEILFQPNRAVFDVKPHIDARPEDFYILEKAH